MLPSILRVLLLCILSCGAMATPVAAIPVEVDAALARARIPRDAVALLVVDADGANAAPRLSHRAQVPMNPASVMKLVTTYAALDLLGPAYTWNTPVYVDGAVRDGTLNGNVYIKGQGDPKLALERLWLLLRRLQGLGIRQIAGDVVLDRSALDLPDTDPASFDGEPLRPYNASPDALLINYKSVVMTFTPDRGSNAAQVQFDPPLYGVLTQNTVPLSNTECGDYRAALKADFSDASRIRFAGSYAADCGEKVWPVAYAEPRSYALRAVQGLWLDMGGKLSGNVRYGTVPAPLAAGKPTLESTSVPLAEIIRDINKFSNNVMAQQLFLTLGRVVISPAPVDGNVPPAPEVAGGLSGGSFIASRAVIQRWWKDRISTEDVPVLDNGSGLSRNERISAQGLALLLQKAYRSPTMPELMSSLPLTGVDGTLKRFKSKVMASAHLKTGSLNNVIARAGYVDGASGKRYILVALINHANASTDAARTVMETLVDWVAKDN
jgi:D-alanyl-D-alanine carboxypeptidase/D-alanyl-D-alanine-endopeptidase (penicillin-binding protein 4)